MKYKLQGGRFIIFKVCKLKQQGKSRGIRKIIFILNQEERTTE
jgi:hypothetical protein